MAKINSRQKGAAGERELAGILTSYGWAAKRGQQFSAAGGNPDVVWPWPIWIECKRVQRLNIEKAMQQARRDCPDYEIPAVFHRANHEPWKVTMDLEAFMAILDCTSMPELVAWLEGEYSPQ